VRPPTGTPLERPLPGAQGPLRSDDSTARSRSAFVVSHHHDGLLHSKATGLLHPATGQGFDAFPASQPQRSPKAALEAVGIPRDAVHTLRRVPLASSRTASLRPLPSCRYCPLHGVSYGRSLSSDRHLPAETGEKSFAHGPLSEENRHPNLVSAADPPPRRLDDLARRLKPTTCSRKSEPSDPWSWTARSKQNGSTDLGGCGLPAPERAKGPTPVKLGNLYR
jgi:hypothetical protein